MNENDSTRRALDDYDDEAQRHPERYPNKVLSWIGKCIKWFFIALAALVFIVMIWRINTLERVPSQMRTLTVNEVTYEAYWQAESRGEELRMFTQGKIDPMTTNEEAYVLNPLNLLKTYTTDEAYADVKPLAEAAIDYAAAAKAYFNGEELDAETAARLAGFDDEIAALSKEIDVSGSGVYNIARATLVLTNKVAIKIGVETEDCVTLEDSDLAMTVRVGDEEYTGFTIQQGSEYVAMVITLGGVGAADFDEVQEITIIDGNEEKERHALVQR